MLSFQKISGKPNLIRNFTGLSKTDFSDLLPAFDKADKADLSSRSRCRLRTIGGGRKPILSSPSDRLLFILFYFKFYPTQEVLGFFFGISQGQASHWIHRLTPIINAALGYEMKLPARKPADVQMLLKECPSLEFIIDGTERPINRPKDAEKQKRYYSGKKKRHTVKNLYISDKETKRIHALSPTYEGKRHDKSIADAQQYHFPEGSTLYKDTGFQGYEPEKITTVQPKKKPRGGQLTDSEKERNREISSQRIRVEHSIGGVKIYRIVRDIYRNRKSGYEDLVIETAVGLYNYRIDRRAAG